ncbi:MAG: hypothetical protein JWO43_440 [Candidatus Adlerbacteria bacterium]|nr:hypothetical protein [Candidatus Adlerbacteria bacterium]
MPPPPKGSTTCAHCLRPIVPGTPVAHAWIGAPHPYTHATFACDESGGAMYAGIWGEYKLHGLHELYGLSKPDQEITLQATEVVSQALARPPT